MYVLYFQQNYSLVNLHPILAARPPPTLFSSLFQPSVCLPTSLFPAAYPQPLHQPGWFILVQVIAAFRD